MANKQAQNLFEALAMIKNLMGSAQTERAAADNQQYNQLLKDEGLRGVYGGRNVEIGNFATPDSKASRLAMEADILKQEPIDLPDIAKKEKESIDNLNEILRYSKNKSGINKQTGGEYIVPKEYQGLTDEDIFSKVYNDNNNKDREFLTKLHNAEMDYKIKNNKNPTVDVSGFDGSKERDAAIAKSLIPSEIKNAYNNNDIAAYTEAVGKAPRAYKALQSMDKGVVDREELQTLRPMIGDRRYKELESNIDAREKPRGMSSSDPNAAYWRAATYIDDMYITPKLADKYREAEKENGNSALADELINISVPYKYATTERQKEIRNAISKKWLQGGFTATEIVSALDKYLNK